MILPVIDDIPAGFKSLETLASGQAIRIMTGAPMPAGADSVIPIESTDGGSEVVTIHSPIELGSCIRHEGEDVKAGEIVLEKGISLGHTTDRFDCRRWARNHFGDSQAACRSSGHRE